MPAQSVNVPAWQDAVSDDSLSFFVPMQCCTTGITGIFEDFPEESFLFPQEQQGVEIGMRGSRRALPLAVLLGVLVSAPRGSYVYLCADRH